jgi:general stress protein 26
MKTLSLFIYALLPMLILVPFTSSGQTAALNDSIKIKYLSSAKEIMTSAGTCALITVDDESRPRVRTMDPFPPENDFTVWFGTNPGSRKVDQIKKNPKVTLYYLANGDSGYVMIQGNAEIVDNPSEKEKYWKTEWEAFYPNKQEAYLLIKVTPVWLEVISYAHGIVGDSATWEPPTVYFNP